MLRPVVEGIYRWTSLQVETREYLCGYLIITEEGPVLVDPPAAAEPIVPQLEALGQPSAVVLTGARRQRRARQYHAWYGAKVYAPVADRELLHFDADELFGTYSGLERLPAGLEPIPMEHQRTPGECALLHEEKRALFAGHLIGAPPGEITIPQQDRYDDFPAALAEHLKLLRLEFDTLLPGKGEPIVTDGRVALARHLASYK